MVLLTYNRLKKFDGKNSYVVLVSKNLIYKLAFQALEWKHDTLILKEYNYQD